MAMGPLYVLLGEVSVQVLCPFFNWIVYLPGIESYEFFIQFGDLYNGILHSRKKEGIPAFYNCVDGTGEHYAK